MPVSVRARVVPEVIKPLAGSITAALFGFGGWVVAQAAALDNPLELVGGSILVTAAVASLWLILRASRYERQSADTIVGRLEDRVEQLEDDLANERHRSARLLLAYDNERTLRLSLEEAGAHDRRRAGRAERSYVTDSDFDELAGEVAAEKQKTEIRERPA